MLDDVKQQTWCQFGVSTVDCLATKAEKGLSNFRVQSYYFRVTTSEFRDITSEFRVTTSEFGVTTSEFRVITTSKFRVDQSYYFRVQSYSNFRVQNFYSRVQNLVYVPACSIVYFPHTLLRLVKIYFYQYQDYTNSENIGFLALRLLLKIQVIV